MKQLLLYMCCALITCILIGTVWFNYFTMHSHTKGFDNLSREILEKHYTIDLTDDCDYEIDTSNYNWTIDDFIILNINIRGLYSKLGDLNRLIERIHRSGAEPTVITISETWLNQHSPSFDVPGYKLFRTDRLHKKGGGVAVLVSSRLTSREIQDLETDATVVESCIVEIKGNKHPIIVTSMYRPPNTDSKLFLEQYKKLITKLKKISPEIIVGLDHNLDFLKSDQHRLTNDFINLILDCQQIPTITRPTRIASHSATLIDNIIVNQSHSEKISSLILIDDTSDHLPCLTVLHDLIPTKNKKLKIKTRSLKHLYRVHEELSKSDWSQLEVETDVDTQTGIFQQRLSDLLDAHCPEVEMEINYKKLRREPWLTKGIMNSIKKCKLLYKKAISLNQDNCDNIGKYKEYNRILMKTKRLAKTTYYIARCTEFRNNTKYLWRTINNIIGKMNNKCELIDHIKVDNIRCYSSQLIANEFGNFFSSIGKRYADKIPASKYKREHYLGKIESQVKSIYLEPMTMNEITRLIDKLPNKTSSGYDNVNNVLLKKLKTELAQPLMIIFNNSLSSGKFPKQMKLAIVVPLYKNKERDLVNNYRPISLLLTISKILEKLVYKRVYGFMCETKQIFDSQYGF